MVGMDLVFLLDAGVQASIPMSHFVNFGLRQLLLSRESM